MPHLQRWGDGSAVSQEQYLPFKPEDLSVNSPNAHESGTRSEACDASVPVVRREAEAEEHRRSQAR